MKIGNLITGQKEYHPKILLYGPLGKGKTAFVGQAGSQGIVMDFDAGYRTIATMDDKWTKLRQLTCLAVRDPDADPPQTFFENDEAKPGAYKAARGYLVSLHSWCFKNPTKRPKLLIVDSFTGLAYAVKSEVLKNSGHEGQPPTQPEWGVIFNELENYLRLFSGLPCVKILVGHDYVAELEGGSSLLKFLCTGKKFPGHVLGFFDDVFYAKIKKGVGAEITYTLTSKSSAAYDARTRTQFKSDWNMDDGLWPFLEKLGYSSDPTEGGFDEEEFLKTLKTDPMLSQRAVTKQSKKG